MTAPPPPNPYAAAPPPAQHPPFPPRPVSAPGRVLLRKPPRTPEQKRAARVRLNILSGVICLALTGLVLWANKSAGRTETMQEVGAMVVVVADLIFFIALTVEFFHTLRRIWHEE